MMNQTTLRGPLLAALAAGGAFLTGCGPPTRGAKPLDSPVAPGIHLYDGIDRSVSYRPHLSAAVTLCAGQAGLLDPATDHLTLYRVDRQTREFSDGPVPDDPDAVQHTLVTQVKNVPPQSGTFPARFWTTVADRAAADQDTAVIGFYSDADNDDLNAASEAVIRAAAQKLAANKRVASVSVYGVNPENRADLRRCFAPLGDRLHLYGPTEMTADAVAEAVDAARSSHF